MRLPRLPFSLSFILVALVAAALPVESVELKVLTASDYHQTVAKGVWFIEFFSPYCSHCKHFKPTWEKLVAEVEKSADPGIHLAQVDCVADGDLCNEMKIRGYPTLNLYRDAEFVEQFQKSRDLEVLVEYVTAHAEKTAPPPVPPPSVPASKDAPPQVTTPRLDYNPDGTVLVLNSHTFAPTLAKGPVFVKYYAPWCGHCKKLAPHWTQLAKEMQHKLTIAEVNCEDEKSLCGKQGVPGYPALYFYSATGAKTEYLGGRKLEKLKAFAEKATEPAVTPIKDEDLEKELRDHEVSFVFVQTTQDAALLNSLTIAAQSLLGEAPVFTSSSPALLERFSVAPSSAPVILVFKDRDPRAPALTYTVPTTSSQTTLQTWLEAHKLPSALELLPDTFQSVMNAPHEPLVVLVAVPKAGEPGNTGAVDQVRELGRQWRERAASYPERQVVFTWMDADRWGSWMKSQYGITASMIPAVVLVDHKQLVYWDTNDAGQRIQLSSTSVFNAIDDVMNKRVTAKNSENFVERMARYLSNKLSGLEQMVVGNPIRSVLFLLFFCGMLAWGLIRLLKDDGMLEGPPAPGGNEKRRRVD